MVTKTFHAVCLNPIKRMANTPWLLAVGVALTLLAAGLGFAAFESTSILDGFYWASTTMTSVGYGDLSPATWYGKVMTIAFQIWSLFVLLPCAISNIIDSVRVDEKAFSPAEQEYVLAYVERDAEEKGYGLGPQPHDYL